MLNMMMIIGNLGQDPEMKYTANGSAVTNFSVAVNERYTTRDGEQREETEWFRVVAWNRLAETCSQYLSKGRQVYVQGRMKTRSWEDNEGVKRYTTELIAREVKFLGTRRDGEDAGGTPAATAAAAASGATAAEGEIDPDDLPF